jgi:hypothetical protein
MHLQSTFDSYPYGKAFNWTGYTVYDAAGLMLRYLKSLPEPVIPLANYENFKTTMSPFAKDNLDEAETKEGTERAQELVAALPPLNRQLLVYLFDVLAVFSSLSGTNGMTAHRLVAAFQPSLLSGPPGVMDADAYNVAAEIIVFLVALTENELLVFT